MILGMSVSTFTTLHVIISLLGLLSGIAVMRGLLIGKRFPSWTVLFLVTTILTSATGFLFHSAAFGPPHILGVISLIVLAVALVALYGRHLAGAWRWIYVVCAVAALYFNFFVGVVQSFQKLSFLQPLAPTQTEPPFQIAQGVLLLIFIAIGFFAVRRFHPYAPAPMTATTVTAAT